MAARRPIGYGPPETIQDRRKVAYNALYALIPSTGAVYLVRGFDERNLLASLTFERLPAGPVLIALRPYPAGASRASSLMSLCRMSMSWMSPMLSMLMAAAHRRCAPMDTSFPSRIFRDR